MPLRELVRSLIVLLTPVLAFLAGALDHPWWVPLLIAPVSLWAFLSIARPARRGPPITGTQRLFSCLESVATLYAAFAVGWLLGILLALPGQLFA